MNLADLLRETNDLSAAVEAAETASRALGDWLDADLPMLSKLVLARVKQATGDRVAAEQIARALSARQQLVYWMPPPPPPPIVDALRAQLNVGDVPVPWKHGERGDLFLRSRPRSVVYAYEHVWIARAQALLQRGAECDEILREIDTLREDAARYPWLAIKLHVLRGRAL